MEYNFCLTLVYLTFALYPHSLLFTFPFTLSRFILYKEFIVIKYLKNTALKLEMSR